MTRYDLPRQGFLNYVLLNHELLEVYRGCGLLGAHSSYVLFGDNITSVVGLRVKGTVLAMESVARVESCNDVASLNANRSALVRACYEGTSSSSEGRKLAALTLAGLCHTRQVAPKEADAFVLRGKEEVFRAAASCLGRNESG